MVLEKNIKNKMNR